jgi:hypothetical protein
MCVALDLSPIATDQRGESRPFGPACDIGAFERGPVAPTDVTISGPTEGVVDAMHTFSATVGIANTTLPITYIWEAEDQESVQQTNVDALTTTVGFVWDTPGTRSITVTADNGSSAPVVDTTQIEIVEASITETLLADISLSGPTTGDVGQSYAFTAQVGPADATVPITYTWTTSDGQEQVQTGGGTSAQATLSWDSAGIYTVMVSADNGLGDPVVDTLEITISEGGPEPGGDVLIYLPLIAR